MNGVTASIENGLIVIRLSPDQAQALNDALIDSAPTSAEADEVAQLLNGVLPDLIMEAEGL